MLRLIKTKRKTEKSIPPKMASQKQQVYKSTFRVASFGKVDAEFSESAFAPVASDRKTPVRFLNNTRENASIAHFLALLTDKKGSVTTHAVDFKCVARNVNWFNRAWTDHKENINVAQNANGWIDSKVYPYSFMGDQSNKRKSECSSQTSYVTCDEVTATWSPPERLCVSVVPGMKEMPTRRVTPAKIDGTLPFLKFAMTDDGNVTADVLSSFSAKSDHSYVVIPTSADIGKCTGNDQASTRADCLSTDPVYQHFWNTAGSLIRSGFDPHNRVYQRQTFTPANKLFWDASNVNVTRNGGKPRSYDITIGQMFKNRNISSYVFHDDNDPSVMHYRRPYGVSVLGTLQIAAIQMTLFGGMFRAMVRVSVESSKQEFDRYGLLITPETASNFTAMNVDIQLFEMNVLHFFEKSQLRFSLSSGRFLVDSKAVVAQTEKQVCKQAGEGWRPWSWKGKSRENEIWCDRSWTSECGEACARAKCEHNKDLVSSMKGANLTYSSGRMYKPTWHNINNGSAYTCQYTDATADKVLFPINRASLDLDAPWMKKIKKASKSDTSFFLPNLPSQMNLLNRRSIRDKTKFASSSSSDLVLSKFVDVKLFKFQGDLFGFAGEMYFRLLGKDGSLEVFYNRFWQANSNIEGVDNRAKLEEQFVSWCLSHSTNRLPTPENPNSTFLDETCNCSNNSDVLVEKIGETSSTPPPCGVSMALNTWAIYHGFKSIPLKGKVENGCAVTKESWGEIKDKVLCKSMECREDCDTKPVCTINANMSSVEKAAYKKIFIKQRIIDTAPERCPDITNCVNVCNTGKLTAVNSDNIDASCHGCCLTGNPTTADQRCAPKKKSPPPPPPPSQTQTPSARPSWNSQTGSAQPGSGSGSNSGSSTEGQAQQTPTPTPAPTPAPASSQQPPMSSFTPTLTVSPPTPTPTSTQQPKNSKDTSPPPEKPAAPKSITKSPAFIGGISGAGALLIIMIIVAVVMSRKQK